MAETDVSSGRSSEPLPISLPSPTWMESKQVASLQLPQLSGSVHTAATSSRACQLGWSRDRELKTLCTRHRDGHCLCLPLGVDEDALGLHTSTSHPFPEMTEISLLWATKGLRSRNLFSFAFS